MTELEKKFYTNLRQQFFLELQSTFHYYIFSRKLRARTVQQCITKNSKIRISLGNIAKARLISREKIPWNISCQCLVFTLQKCGEKMFLFFFNAVCLFHKKIYGVMLQNPQIIEIIITKTAFIARSNWQVASKTVV